MSRYIIGNGLTHQGLFVSHACDLHCQRYTTRLVVQTQCARSATGNHWRHCLSSSQPIPFLKSTPPSKTHIIIRSSSSSSSSLISTLDSRNRCYSSSMMAFQTALRQRNDRMPNCHSLLSSGSPQRADRQLPKGSRICPTSNHNSSSCKCSSHSSSSSSRRGG